MANLFLTLKLLHIIGATVLFGAGLGIAFFMFMANRMGDPAAIAYATRTVVMADALFIASAVVVQPLTGWAMAAMLGYSLTEGWIAATLVLYVLVGLCWLPVVLIQIEMRDVAAASVRDGLPLPDRYHAYFRTWFWLGWPAFIGVMAIFVLMLWKPVLF